jgi:hypothetical protein
LSAEREDFEDRDPVRISWPWQGAGPRDKRSLTHVVRGDCAPAYGLGSPCGVQPSELVVTICRSTPRRTTQHLADGVRGCWTTFPTACHCRSTQLDDQGPLDQCAVGTCSRARSVEAVRGCTPVQMGLVRVLPSPPGTGSLRRLLAPGDPGIGGDIRGVESIPPISPISVSTD